MLARTPCPRAARHRKDGGRRNTCNTRNTRNTRNEIRCEQLQCHCVEVGSCGRAVCTPRHTHARARRNSQTCPRALVVHATIGRGGWGRGRRTTNVRLRTRCRHASPPLAPFAESNPRRAPAPAIQSTVARRYLPSQPGYPTPWSWAGCLEWKARHGKADDSDEHGTKVASFV